MKKNQPALDLDKLKDAIGALCGSAAAHLLRNNWGIGGTGEKNGETVKIHKPWLGDELYVKIQNWSVFTLGNAH